MFLCVYYNHLWSTQGGLVTNNEQRGPVEPPHIIITQEIPHLPTSNLSSIEGGGGAFSFGCGVFPVLASNLGDDDGPGKYQSQDETKKYIESTQGSTMAVRFHLDMKPHTLFGVRKLDHSLGLVRSSGYAVR